MKINREKHIGRVLFIVEGSQTEFTLLRRVFCNVLGYSYLEKRRNRPDFFVSTQDKYSQVAVINTRESNIRDISENDSYLDEVMDMLRENYSFPVDSSAIYYLFDRDPKSNLNVPLMHRQSRIVFIVFVAAMAYQTFSVVFIHFHNFFCSLNRCTHIIQAQL